MNVKQKERLEQLKRDNREKRRKRDIENNVLLSECIAALGACGKVLEQEEKSIVYQAFKEKIPFSPWRIDWRQFSSMQRIDNIEELYERCKSKEFYIIWHEKLPVIKSDIGTIIRNIYDICAVEFDTWVLSADYSEIIEFYHEGEITYGVVKENTDSQV